MSETLESAVTVALTFKVPQKVGWSTQRSGQSWVGNELLGLVDCLAQEVDAQQATLSLSLIFELRGSGGTVRA